MKTHTDLSDAQARLMEEKLFEQVADELSRGERRNGLWLKALSMSDGSEVRASSLYIQLRIQSILDEGKIEHHLSTANKYSKTNTNIDYTQKGWGDKESEAGLGISIFLVSVVVVVAVNCSFFSC